jgi:cytochrome c554/c'-like protein
VRLAKLLLGICALALLAWLLFALFTSPRAVAEARTFTSSQQCAECHAQQAAEWRESWHAQAWTDPEARALSNDFSNTDCIDCHAPRPTFETGVGQRVLPRAVRRIEGVDCITCHELPGEGVAGTLTNPGAPCRPVARTELLKPEFCAPCHDQHDTVKQWAKSRFAEPGPGFKDCLGCHMPVREPVAGGGTRGRDHRMLGGHDLELLQSAVTLRGARDPAGGWTVEVENVGAGHNFPTDERSRAADLFWRPVGEPAWRALYRFRNPYRFEVDLENTELAAGAQLAVPLNDPAAAGAPGGVEVGLFYKLSPYWKDPEHPDPEHEARLVHSVRLGP